MSDVLSLQPAELQRLVRAVFQTRPEVVYEIKNELKYLSPTQLEFYNMVKAGASTSEDIMKLTGKSQKTVSTHLKSMVELGVLHREVNKDKWGYRYGLAVTHIMGNK